MPPARVGVEDVAVLANDHPDGRLDLSPVGFPADREADPPRQNHRPAYLDRALLKTLHRENS